MEYIIQLYTGGFANIQVTEEKIIEKLKSCFDKIPIYGVIIGWGIDINLYRKVLQLASQHKKKLYLWLPVFSEIGGIKSSQPAIDYLGKKVLPISLQEGESFLFACPSHSINVQNVKDVYVEFYSDIAWDGIFLDRIRYGSFANGKSAVLSCFCEICQKRYEQEGISIKDLVKRLQEKENHLLIPLTFKDGQYRFKDDLINKFFKAKQQIITEQIKNLVQYFSAQGKKVGLDVFAPMFAPFVGQDLSALGEVSEFLKPMMYRVTNAPAGIPYEWEYMIQELKKNNSYPVEERMKKILNLETAGVACIQTLEKEIESLMRAGCKVYPGVEVNNKERICDSTIPYIKQSIDVLEKIGVEKVVLSWDIMSAPEDHINALMPRC